MLSRKLKWGKRIESDWVRDTIIKYVVGHGRHPLGGSFEHVKKEGLRHTDAREEHAMKRDGRACAKSLSQE